MLKTEQLTLMYDTALIIDQLTVEVVGGQITALVGPNGCGKSTLLRGLARLLKPKAGAVMLDGVAIHRIPTKMLARQIGILPQSPTAPEGLTVRELVAQGRYPHQTWFQQWSEADEAATNKALTITNMTALADRPVDALSGGQRQRAWIAMALAQETTTLLLDEPTTFLDMAHQLEVLHLLERLNKEEKRTIIMVVHDLNHATRFAQQIIAMANGEIVATGTPQAVVTPETIRSVFGVEADIVLDPRTGTPLCIPYGLRSATEEPAVAAALANGHAFSSARLAVQAQ